MSYENSAGLNVHNHYGVRDTGGSVGVETGSGSEKTLRVSFTGRSLNDGYVPPVYVPAGASVKSAYLRVDEAFAVTGTAPLLEIGEKGAEATNGVTITGAQLGAVDTIDVSSALAGTWDQGANTTASKAVGILLDDLAVTNAGSATLVVEYLDVAR